MSVSGLAAAIGTCERATDDHRAVTHPILPPLGRDRR
jgi:hypothetical protein